MTEAEKLLQETKSAVVAETQTEDICVIDSDLRIIDIPEQFKVLGVENDKDVKVMQFRMPKVYKGTDLSAFNISVNYQNARGTKDRYVVTDKKVSGDQIEFSWTVGKTATVYRGDTRFIVCMRLIGSDGVIKKEFNTTLSTMTVLEGLEVDNPVIEQEEKDIIAQLLQIVDDKSKEAVQAVTAEGTKQIKAVQAAAQEIVADREQIKTNKEYIADLMQTKAGAIINSARGERIAVGDSADAFFEGLKLFGKSEQVQTKGYQLFDASEVKPASMGGATVTANSDGSYTVSGTGRLTKDFWIGGGYSHDEVLKLFKAGKLTVSAKETMPKVYVSLSGSKGKHFEIYAGETVNITKEMLEDTNLSVGFGIYGSTSKEIIPGTVKPMIYQDGDGTWEPYTGGKPSPSMEYKQDPESSGDGGEISINMHGYNLFNASKIPTKSAGGATVTNNGDGSFTVSGSGNLTEQFQSEYRLTRKETVSLFKKGKIKGTRSAGTYATLPYFRMIGRSNSGVFEIIDGSEITDEHLTDESFVISFDFIANKTNTIKPGTVKPMIYQDGNGAFEPFIPLRSTQLSTPNGLPGLPVDSDGNYTDSNGQQWICDEMDFKRGKYVQRIKKLTLDGSEAWFVQEDSAGQHQFFIDLKDALYPYNASDFDKSFLCNHFKSVSKAGDIDDGTVRAGVYKETFAPVFKPHGAINRISKFKSWLSENPTTILYILATPIETDIPEETMTAYRNLYTNYPSTVIQNDSGAGMEVEYVADTKQFILDQIKALVQA